MKNCFIQIILFTFLCVCTSCKNKESKIEFSAKPIVKTVGKIDVMVDPKVEMMMILGRLGNVVPYSGEKSAYSHPYLDRVDECFAPYKEDVAIKRARVFWMTGYLLPEFGMYLKDDMSSFIMNPQDENFVTLNGPAKNFLFYNHDTFRELVKDFRINSNFDKFFIENESVYDSMFNRVLPILEKINISSWIEDFYGEEIKDKLRISLTQTSFCSYGLSVSTPEGNRIPHIILWLREIEEANDIVVLLSHEFSHPYTKKITDALCKNKEVYNIFNKLFQKYGETYNKCGYYNTENILNEIINQACSNKFLEKTLSKEYVDFYKKYEVDSLKQIYVPAIAEFLDNYQNNRDKYKTLEDFIPELEEFILTLE